MYDAQQKEEEEKEDEKKRKEVTNKISLLLLPFDAAVYR